MEKEIRSKENIELLKGKKEVRVKTTIDNLRTYNERIIKENIYLTTPEKAPYDFYIKTEKGNNIGYIKINEDGPETYTIEKDTILGHLVEESNINKIR